MLTGKYVNGIPKGSRGALKGFNWLKDELTDKDKIAKVRKLMPIAKELGCTLAQFSLAWCAKNPNVSTVITGASRVEQVHENLKALELLPKLTDDVMKRVDKIVGKPEIEEF
jgi:aryl-alcohol dehydrogenase-like predicted oxidoreductase